MRTRLLAGLAIVLLAQEQPASPPARKPGPSDAFFAKGEIPKVRIDLDAAELEKLRADARTYVHATIREEKTVYEDVAIKLKGAAGSFRELDDKPAFTVNFDKFRDGQEFHGLQKLHLNNSVQDPTWLNEQLCSELMASAGVPATRVTHARVWLNGRDLGLYVLKEAFDKPFLKRHFESSKGNLYDGGFCQDVDAELEKDSGDGPDDRSDLAALVDACRDPEPSSRFPKLAGLVDVDAFLTFMAMELSTGHWDGYSLNRNNYRLYFEPKTKKAHFLPHGMDQMFQDPDASVIEYPTALVAESVMRNPEWRAQYRKRLTELLPLFAAKPLVARLEQLADHLRPTVKSIGGAKEWSDSVKEFEERVAARDKSLREQNKRPEPKTLEFDPKGMARLPGWHEAVDEGEPKIEQVTTAGKRAWKIDGGASPCAASWRKKVMLARGRYSLEASVKTRDVVAREDDPASGACLRILGSEASLALHGTQGWQPLAVAFEVKEETRLVELACELRAARGEAWFELASLRLVKLP